MVEKKIKIPVVCVLHNQEMPIQLGHGKRMTRAKTKHGPVRRPATGEKKMKSYAIEFNGSGEVCDGMFASESAAQSWVESVLETRGYDPSELVSGDWDADGQNNDGEQCYRMLFWANDSDADNDSGANAICKLCQIEN